MGSMNVQCICINIPSSTAQLFSGHFMNDNTSSDNNLQSYTPWIRDGVAHLSGISQDIRVPPEATAVTDPLNVTQWKNP